jgi:phosphoenolpyruvate synthase/pyruvate phosphate dikinase
MFQPALTRQKTLGDRLQHSGREGLARGREKLRESLLSSSGSDLLLSSSTIRRVSQLVISLNSPGEALEDVFTNATVGGKALHLAELIAHAKVAGDGSDAILRVPSASVCTTHAYNAHIASLGLEQELARILATGDVAALPVVRERILGPARSDLDLELAVNQFLAQVPQSVSRFAVRSSSTAEDQGANSFAGQYETCLNVPRNGIVAAIKRCWASMWVERLISYRAQAGFKATEQLSMAVVIQQQVHSEAAGVAFSLNPVTGAQDETVVESVWGQGS